MLGRLWTFLVRCHHRWYSPLGSHEVSCQGNRFHAGPHHEHDDYARHH